MNEIRNWMPALAALAMLVTAPQNGIAESHDESAGAGYMMAHFDRVNPSHVADFEANAKRWVDAFKAAEMGQEWSWQAFSGPDFTYAWISSMPSFAFLDSQEARQKEMMEALGEEKLAELMKGFQFIDRHHTEVVKPRPDLSYRPAESVVTEATVAHLGIHHVRPAMAEQFVDLVKRVKAAFEKAEAPMGFEVYEVQFGTGSYHVVATADSMAQLHSQPETGAILAEAEGPEAAQKMLAEWADCVSGYETSDWRIRRELSYLPYLAQDKTE